MDSDSEPELISLVTQLMSSDDKPTYTHGLLSSYSCPKLIPIITQITSLVGSMDLDSQPKPESKLMSVVAQTISLFHSIDLDSQPKPLSELISLLISKSSKDADLDPELVSDLVTQTLLLQTEPELISLIHQIFSLVVSMNAKWKKLISLCPQFEAWMNDEKFVYENTAGGRDYDEDKQCHACITPIYFGNFYSCMQCDFILHEACANLSRKILNPIHPHLLSLALVERKDGVYAMSSCKACRRYYTAGFVYECTKGEECNFELHVQCATISEPLIHGSHMQPLFLTSKPGEGRTCSVCDTTEPVFVETFNCIECEFSLCYGCATTPQKVRYKHDKHVLSLAYGGEEETNTVTNWCELCERKIEPKERFYACA